MNIYLLILILLLPLLLLAAFALRRIKWISNLFLAAAAGLFVLLLADFTYRWFLKPKDPVVYSECANRCDQYDSVLGFKPAIPGKWTIRTVYNNTDTIINTQYTIIKDSLRRALVYDHRIGYRNEHSQQEVVFVGCSFTFGAGIGDTATLPYHFGKLANVSAVNLGCAAYGLHQVYGVYSNRYASQDNRNRIFVYSLLSDHFYRASGIYDWNVTGPYYELKQDSLWYKGPAYHFVRMRYRRAPYLLSFFGALKLVYDKTGDIFLRKRMKGFSKEEYNRIYLMLQKMAASIAATGGKLIIINWDRSNWGYQGYEFPYQQQLDNDVSKLGVEVLPVSSIINYNDASNFIPNDGHPTSLANFRIAKALANKFR